MSELAAALEHLVSATVRSAVVDAIADLDTAPARLVYTIEEVAELLAVSDKSVRNLIRSGRLWTVDLDGSRTVRIPAAAVDALLARPQEPASR